MDEATRQATRLWTKTQPVVSAFVASIVRDFQDRDDVLQEIAVAALDSFEKYDPERPFVAWVMGIARNQVGLYLRQRRRDRLIFDEETTHCLAQAFSELPETETRKLDALAHCLKALEGRARQLCQLRYREDLKPAAIAERIGMSANGVAKALQRVREQLRLCVERTDTTEGAVS